MVAIVNPARAGLRKYLYLFSKLVSERQIKKEKDMFVMCLYVLEQLMMK